MCRIGYAVFKINFSYGSKDETKETVANVAS